MPHKPDYPDYEPLRGPNSRRFEEESVAGWKRSASQKVTSTGFQELGVGGSPNGEGVLNSAAITTGLNEFPLRSLQPQKQSLLRRGHALSYVGLFLFTFVLYFRPYELFSALNGLDTMAFVLAVATLLVFLPTQFALEGNITAPIREVKLVLLLCLAGLLSIPGAIVPSEAWTAFNDVFIKAVLMFVVMVNVVRTEKRLRGLIYIALSVTILLCVNAISDFRNNQFAVEGYRIKGLLGGMFGNPNDLALHFVTMMPLSVGLMMASRKFLGKVMFASIAILIVTANVVTYSRGGFLGLVATVIMLAWKIGRDRRMMVAIVGPICISIFVALAPGNYGLRILSIFVPSLDPVGSSTARQEVLGRSVITSLRHPLFGIGMGNFHTVSLGETVTHNAFTQISAEMGFAALIVYLMFLTGSMRSLRKIERETFVKGKKSRYYYLAIGLQASLVGYMVSGFFAAVAYQWYAYYLVAYAVCLRRIYAADPSRVVATPVANTETRIAGLGLGTG